MFIVDPQSDRDRSEALELIDKFDVHTNFLENEIIVSQLEAGHKGAIELQHAELGFAMTFLQEGNVCPLCKDHGIDFCGHLIFTRLLM